MSAVIVTPYSLGRKFLGIHEMPGPAAHPYLSWALSLSGMGATPSDEIPNCSAWLYSLCWLLDLPRPLDHAARARSWLLVGEEIPLEEARQGYDVVVFKRGGGYQPPETVLDAPGHVGLYSSHDDTHVWLLGANQGDAVSVARFPVERVLGVRRLA